MTFPSVLIIMNVYERGIKMPNEELLRLQKIIADRGYCSRRHAEELIEKGKVRVNGILVTELGSKFHEDVNITISGVDVPPVKKTNFTYLLINKPIGVVTTMSDDRGRRIVTELVPSSYGRLFPVGRLDINTSGLLILTDDGEFANLVTHPSSMLEKTYLAKITGVIKPDEIKRLKNGVMLEDGLTSPAKVEIQTVSPEFSIIKVTIHEGKKREVRRMINAVGHEVIALMRVQIGPIKLTLKTGQHAEAKMSDIELIKKICIQNRSRNTYVKNNATQQN